MHLRIAPAHWKGEKIQLHHVDRETVREGSWRRGLVFVDPGSAGSAHDSSPRYRRLAGE